MISFGIDSSNYRSSAAAILDDGRYISKRKLLYVSEGSRGLRQSDAVFLHTKQLPDIVSSVLKDIKTTDIKCVGVSTKPRRLEDSYMPCFLVGEGLAKALSTALNVPLYNFSHQEGHIAAALLSADCMQISKKPFIAFHISGGTTEALLVEQSDIGYKTQIVAKTLDLNIGQIMDRVGVMLGLLFPCGEELEKLALKGKTPKTVKVTLKGMDCALSGVENQCKTMLDKGESKENIARFAIEYSAEVLYRMTTQIREKYGDLPVVYSGGVMADEIIKAKLSEFGDVYFASVELSGDNAVGIAYLAKRALERELCNKSV